MAREVADLLELIATEPSKVTRPMVERCIKDHAPHIKVTGAKNKGEVIRRFQAQADPSRAAIDDLLTRFAASDPTATRANIDHVIGQYAPNFAIGDATTDEEIIKRLRTYHVKEYGGSPTGERPSTCTVVAGAVARTATGTAAEEGASTPKAGAAAASTPKAGTATASTPKAGEAPADATATVVIEEVLAKNKVLAEAKKSLAAENKRLREELARKNAMNVDDSNSSDGSSDDGAPGVDPKAPKDHRRDVGPTLTHAEAFHYMMQEMSANPDAPTSRTIKSTFTEHAGATLLQARASAKVRVVVASYFHSNSALPYLLGVYIAEAKVRELWTWLAQLPSSDLDLLRETCGLQYARIRSKTGLPAGQMPAVDLIAYAPGATGYGGGMANTHLRRLWVIWTRVAAEVIFNCELHPGHRVNMAVARGLALEPELLHGAHAMPPTLFASRAQGRQGHAGRQGRGASAVQATPAADRLAGLRCRKCKQIGHLVKNCPQ